jgi:hypothetical protein
MYILCFERRAHLRHRQHVVYPCAELTASRDAVDRVRAVDDALRLHFQAALSEVAAHVPIAALRVSERRLDGLRGGVRGVCRGDGQRAQEGSERVKRREQLLWKGRESEGGPGRRWCGGCFGDELGVELGKLLRAGFDESSLEQCWWEGRSGADSDVLYHANRAQKT